MLTAFLALAAPAAQGDVFVQTRRMTPPLWAANAEVAAADFDADGDLDAFLAHVHLAPAHLEPAPLMRNAGGGVLESVPGAVPVLDLDPVGVAAGDLDGDGDADVLVIDYSLPHRVLLNQGGSFVHAGDIAFAGVGASAGALGDLDQDGDLDLFTTHAAGYTPGQNRVYDNAGTGSAWTWDPAAVPASLTYSRDLALSDLDGDSDLDVYLCNDRYGDLPIAVDGLLRNQGGGVFAEVAGLLAHSSYAISQADLDNDGDLDGYVGAGNWAGGVGELLVWNSGAVPWSATPGPFSPPTGWPWMSGAVLASDFGADGWADLLGTGLYLWPRIARGQGGGAFVETSAADVPAVSAWGADATGSSFLASGDFDGDSDLDVLWPGADNDEPLLWLNHGGSFGAFDSVPQGSPYNSGAAVGAGDVDGDGDLDLMTTAHGPSALALTWAGDGTGAFADGVPAVMPGGENLMNDLELSDLDGDADPDALIVRYASGGAEDASVHLNDGSGAFAELAGAVPPLAGVDAAYQGERAVPADVDGDGDVDFALTGIGSSVAAGLHLLRNGGGGAFSTSVVKMYGPEVPLLKPPQFGDIDGDGDEDLLWTGPFIQAALLANDGAGVFTDISAGHIPPLVALSSALGDLDGDGDLDAVLSFTLQSQVLLNDGSGLYTAGSTLPSLFGSEVHLDDWSGDGDLDLIGVFSKAWISPGDGAGGFSGSAELAGLAPFRSFLADVDGDGDRDLVGSRLDGARPIVLTRVLGGQVARRGVPRIGKPLLMQVFGPPAKPWALAAAPLAASIPLSPFGTLLLDPAQIWLLAAGSMPAAGVVTVKVPVGDDPALVGVTIHWQALTGAPLRFTNREATAVTAY